MLHLTIRFISVACIIIFSLLITIMYQACSDKSDESGTVTTETDSISNDDSTNEELSEPKQEPKALVPLPEADPVSIWEYITKDNPYKNWALFPMERIPEFKIWKDDFIVLTTKIPLLAGSVGKIYLNDIALAALDEKPRDLPYNSIIIVEISTILNNKNAGDPWLISGRYKVKGSTNRDNDWVTFEYNPSGQIVSPGNGPGFGTKTICYSCHELSENDYVWIDSPRLDEAYTNVPHFNNCVPRQ